MGVYTTARKEKKLIISDPEEQVCSLMKICINILLNRCRCIKTIREFDAARDVHDVCVRAESAAAPEVNPEAAYAGLLVCWRKVMSTAS